MPSYPYYVLEGTSLNDDAGRWHESSEHNFQPRFAGYDAAETTALGIAGATPTRVAPGRTGLETIQMTFNAIDQNGKRARSFLERQQFIYRNIEDFYREINLAMAMVNPRQVLEKHIDFYTVRYAYGRIESSAEPEYKPGQETAKVKFIFRIHDVYWRSETYTTYPNTVTGATLFGWTGQANAPIQDAIIRIMGPATDPTVTGPISGFTLKQTIADGQCVDIDTKQWKVTAPIPTGTPIGTSRLLRTANIQPVGPTTGSLLTLIPDKQGQYSLTFGAGNPGLNTGIQVQYKEAYN